MRLNDLTKGAEQEVRLMEQRVAGAQDDLRDARERLETEFPGIWNSAAALDYPYNFIPLGYEHIVILLHREMLVLLPDRALSDSIARLSRMASVRERVDRLRDMVREDLMLAKDRLAAAERDLASARRALSSAKASVRRARENGGAFGRG